MFVQYLSKTVWVMCYYLIAGIVDNTCLEWIGNALKNPLIILVMVAWLPM